MLNGTVMTRPKITQEFKNFDAGMDTILKADPKAVKAAMEAEKQEHERTGKKRGPKPKTSALRHPHN
jgi:hypothetical protein